MVEAAPLPVGKRRSSKGAQTRATAARVVADVLSARISLSDALERRVARLSDEKDRALVQELSYGVLRWLPRYEALAQRMLQRRPEALNPEIRGLLLVGLYQISELRVPDHAAVSETVEAARLLGKGWATGLVNALLRRFQKEQTGLESRLSDNAEVRWCFPSWLLHRLQGAWPEHWREILEASNARPPLALRVNPLRVDRDAYLERLAAAGIVARPIAHASQGLILDQRVPATSLPGFAEGLFSVQDGAAQLAAPLLDLAPGQRVLDACAAPGGKTTHIAELGGAQVALTAVDLDPVRVKRIAENLARLGLHAELAVGDAVRPRGPWSEQHYDRILLDVPCSATGVIRRHPDIKWLRRPTDVVSLAEDQARILDAVWPLLRPGGVLVYATCSLLPEENDRQLEAFRARHPDVRERPIAAAWGRKRSVGVQILPGDQDMDGFYYGRFEKCAA